jgi:outer membrane protein OmpA-like peptidoglycan-associated protein/predicted aconitase with swiveling domain
MTTSWEFANGGRLKRAAWFGLVAVVMACSGWNGWGQSLAERLKGVQSGHEGPPAPTLPAWKPVSSTTSKMTIPLVKGLLVSGAQAGEKGDKEQIRKIDTVTPAAATLVIEWDTPSSTPGKPPDRKVSSRIVDKADLATSHRLMGIYQIGKLEHYPGSTGWGVSAEVINQLRSTGASEVLLAANPDPIVTIVAMQKYKNEMVGWNGHPLNKCELQRVGAADVAMPMLVNGLRVELAVIHGMCKFGGEDTHLYLLDQPSNPLVLASQGEDGLTQMVRIDFPPEIPAEAASSMEQALEQKKPVEVYGIYFDFNSATIKPDSETVLKQISDILHKNPSWKLSVSGHTDNIGDAAFNQGLSERRAAAVKNALVTRYGISADRLTTKGYGASRPIETNSTLEGRARNRRVELQRQ